LGLVNRVLAAKLPWSILSDPEALWSKIIRARYLKNKSKYDIIHSSDLPKGSSIWNSISKEAPCIVENIFWYAMDSETVNFL
jgi:hypothetical protein